MLRNSPLLGRFLLFVISPLMVLMAGGYAYFISGLPTAESEISLDGIAAPVSVQRDALGIPHIAARTDRDVFFATGYVHAQDRLWQLEMQRRLGQGRLSEVFGSDALDQDIWMRTLSLEERAQNAWNGLSKEARDSLQAYADGVNAWLRHHPRLPPEFVMLDVKPEPWRPVDSLIWLKVFQLQLSGNFSKEIRHFAAAQTMNADQLRAFGLSPGSPVPRVAMADQAGRMAALYRKVQASLKMSDQYLGSNAWVIAPRLTGGRGTLIANDPHLGLHLPSVWYPIVQRGATLRVSGMGLVGLPPVIFGRNDAIAWGGTSMMADTQDLYIEQIEPSNPQSYHDLGSLSMFSKRDEFIKVKEQFPSFLRSEREPVRVTVRSSRRGPIVSDAITPGGQAISMKWVGLNDGDTTYEGLLKLGYASDWRSFNDALQLHVAPALNMLYSDASGNIGYVGVGRIPIRAGSNDSMPKAGWLAGNEWTGYIPFEGMPRQYNPENGYIVSANNKMVDAAYPYFISHDWAPAARADRIGELIRARSVGGHALTVEDMKAIQLDMKSVPAARIAAMVSAARTTHVRQREALAYLNGWQGSMERDSVAATLVTVWTKHFLHGLFDRQQRLTWTSKSPLRFEDSLFTELSTDDIAAILEGKNPILCPAQGKGPACETLVLSALEETIAELDKLKGKAMSAWRWGEVHFALYPHQPFSKVKILDTIFERRAPGGGSPDTVNVANAAREDGKGYRQSFGPGFRQIVALADGTAVHVFSHAGGQSGNLFSKHYEDSGVAFNAGQYFLLDSGAPASHAATLVPAKAKHQ